MPKSVRLTRWYGQAVVPKVQPQTPCSRADTGRPVIVGWLDMSLILTIRRGTGWIRQHPEVIPEKASMDEKWPEEDGQRGDEKQAVAKQAVAVFHHGSRHGAARKNKVTGSSALRA